MNTAFRILVPSVLAACASVQAVAGAACADSVDVVAYAPLDGDGGMRLAWRECAGQEWRPIGSYAFVSSDFGPWGVLKKMYAPVLSRQAGGWALEWIADPEDGVLARAESPDLMAWKPQTYALSVDGRGGAQQYIVAGQAVSGSVARLGRGELDALQRFVEKRGRLAALYDEKMADDPERFAGLKPLAYEVKPRAREAKAISDMLIGIFIEDINYAADGGLYAELVQNRDFEYNPADKGGDKNWNALKCWNFPTPDLGRSEISDYDPIHGNNPHYLSVDAKPGYRISNDGFDGVSVRGGETYDFAMMARGKGCVTVSIEDSEGRALASDFISIDSQGWTEYTCELPVGQTVADAKLFVTVNADSKLDLDMVSLFPRHTFKGRKNGLRADLAQALADLHPRFVRFPGGCVAHGDGIDNIYDWKGSIGPLEARKPLRNLWGYHQTRGLGYYEYFQLCEDIGAEPLPVLAAGVPCQNSGTAAHHSHDALTKRGQQCGIPMEEMDAYIQDVLDLIEWANGPADSKWGAKRAQAGHPEPFNLKYIGIGNEDMITEVFEERFRMIYDAVHAVHPEVEVVGTVGPFYEGADYDAGWRLARELSIPYVDEHYYVSPGWMIYNQDYYDGYERGGTKVYLGEYAAHLPGRPSNVETALAEALYLTSVERNGDVVAMTSYAPLLSKDRRTQWRPDLIYFSNSDVRPSVDYYVQMLYGQNSGDVHIPASATLSTTDEKAMARVGSSIVRDSKTGDIIIKLANLLPVEVDAAIDASALGIKSNPNAKKWVIAGAPGDKNAKPQESAPAKIVRGVLSEQLPPYSFTVIRLPKK